MRKQPIEEQIAELRAPSEDAAIAKLQKRIDGKLVVVSSEVIAQGTSREVAVDAFDAKDARSQAKGLLEAQERVTSVKEEQEAKRGFLGLGKAPGTFKVRIRRMPLVRVVYKEHAKRCPYYKGTACTVGGRLGNPLADPTMIIGWDTEMCSRRGGAGCPHKKVGDALGPSPAELVRMYRR